MTSTSATSTGMQRLEAAIGSFDIASISGEALCLSIGEVLGRAFEDFQSLSDNFRTVEEIFNGDEVEKLSQTIEQVRATVTGLAGGLSAECDKVDALARLNDDLATRIGLIRRSVRSIAAMATNSRVEAASIDTRSGEISSFAVELVALATKAQQSIDSCCVEQAALSRMLKAARRTLVDFKHTQGGDLADAERDLSDVGASIEAHRTRLTGAAADLGERAKDITLAIGTIVMALQIGDSTRQRLEHALDCLQDANRLYDDAGEAEAGYLVSCGLAVRQAAGARHDFGQAIGQVEAALRKLSGQADEIVGAARKIFETGNGQSQSFIDGIAAKLGTALRLSQTAGSARSAADRAVAEIIKTTAKLEDQMGVLSDVTESMTMIGINAVLKAKRVGAAGLGLGVIADQLRSGATRIVADVKSLTPELGRTVAETQALADLFSYRRAEDMDEDTALAKQALAALTRCDTGIRLALETLVDVGGRVAQDLARAATGPAIVDTVDQMGRLCAALEELAGGSLPPKMAGLDVAPLERAAADRYTMAAERQIDAAYWATQAGPERTMTAA